MNIRASLLGGVVAWAMLSVLAPAGIAQVQFVPSQPLPGSNSSEALALGDMDGDGDLDLILGYLGQNHFYVNDGTGAFTHIPANMPPDSDLTRAVALGDVDGDGDLDLVFANHAQQNRLYINNGTGTFSDATAARMPSDSYFSRAVALHDVDGDGDLDLVLGTISDLTRLYLNDGTGVFSDVTHTHMPQRSGNTYDMALGDVDKDGDPDLVLGNDGQNRLYLNDGMGTFTDATSAQMPSVTEITLGVSMGDVDGDDVPDLVFANAGQNRLYINYIVGTFYDATAGRIPFVNDLTRAVALGDVDEDGDRDLIFGNAGESHLYLNDGNANFTDATATRMLPNNNSIAVALADVDGDSDPDLIFRTPAGNDGLYLNLHRQLLTPLHPILSRSFPMDFYAKPGYGTTLHTAIPALTLALAPSPLSLPPLGNLYLDLNRIIPLPTVTIPTSTGRGRLEVTVPADTTLVGVTVYVQALIVNNSDPQDSHLSGYTADVIMK